jgi:S-(hydroxymethyl)glutathione dehydrogenase/alcohol dehydrogenase
LGATDVVDPTSTDPLAAVQELTYGRKADFVFEAVGNPETIMQAYKLARRGGTIVTIGMPRLKDRISVSAFRLFYEEKRLVGCYYGSAQVRRDLPRFVRLVEAGQLDLGSLVSERISLEDVNTTFKALESGQILRNVIV